MGFVSSGGIARSVLAVATVLASTPFSAGAVPKNSDPTLPGQINAAVEPLLFEARKTVSNSFTRVKAVQSKSRDLNTIGQNLDAKSREARQAYDTATEKHGAALDALYSAKVAGTTVSAILNLNTKLRDQVRNFRDQAINTSATSFISGDQFRGRRRAMSEIVQSEKAYVGQVSALLDDTSSWLDRFRAELDNLSRQQDSNSLSFGLDHYLTLAHQRLDARRTQLASTTPFFNGKDPSGNAKQPIFQCSSESSATFRSFSGQPGDLEVVVGWTAAPRVYASTNPAVYSWSRVMSEGALAAYDGNQQTGAPGYIQAWTSCVTSKDRSTKNLEGDIRDALARGEVELAKSLDLQRAQLDFEKTVLSGQLKVVTHRRDQLARIMSSAAAQASSEDLAAYPDAWRKTVAAHAKDLSDVSTAFPELFATAITLLDDAEAELNALDGLENWEEIRTRLNFAVRNIEIIRKDGFERLLAQLESVDQSLEAMATGIADGDSILSEELAVYERKTATIVEFLQAEMGRIPAKIAAAQSRTRATSDALSKARGEMNTSAGKLKLFQDKLKELNDATRLYNSTFGLSRLNPIYTALVDELMKRASTKKSVAKKQAELKRQLQQTLSGFNGTIVVPEPSKDCRRGQANCTSINKVKVKNAAAKALHTTQKSMLREVPDLISLFSRKMAGISLTDLVAKIEGAHRTMMGLK